MRAVGGCEAPVALARLGRSYVDCPNVHVDGQAAATPLFGLGVCIPASSQALLSRFPWSGSETQD